MAPPAQKFESVPSAALRRRLSSTTDAKKPNVAAAFSHLTVSLAHFAQLHSLIYRSTAYVGRSCR